MTRTTFYGNRYFTQLQEEHGLPGLNERTRADLPERCIFWLRTLLKYRLPPGRILELGSAHGGFVALMRWAGFDATGVDLSPWLCNFARMTFDVPMLIGPLESQDIAAETLDAVVLMDVLEHLGNPAATLSRSLSLLKHDGTIFLQTPQYREGKSLQEMEQEHDPFSEYAEARSALVSLQQVVLDYPFPTPRRRLDLFRTRHFWVL